MNNQLTSHAASLLRSSFVQTSSVETLKRSPEVSRPPHSDVAIQEQYDAAVAAGDKSAYSFSFKDILNIALRKKCEN